MTLAEHLADTGVRLSGKIGFIIESGSETDGWAPHYARIGKVVTGIPAGAEGQEEVQDFDPEYDLLVLWHVGDQMHLYVLRMTTGASVYKLEQGGLVIAKEDSRIFVGQSDRFMQSVCDIMCALA